MLDRIIKFCTCSYDCKDLHQFKPTLNIFNQADEHIEEFKFDFKHEYEYVLEQKWKVGYTYMDLIHIELIRSEFETIQMKDILNESRYDVFNLRKRVLGIADEKFDGGVRARHDICVPIIMDATGDTIKKCALFRAEVLHLVALQWSSVTIMSVDNKDLFATSHFIDHSQLPYYLNNNKNDNIITYDRNNERSMLVRSLNGDAFILKGNSNLN
jgi:hypothetical protein